MYIIITIDTENLQTPTRLGQCKENLLDNRKYGYTTIMDICDELDIKSTFFFSPYESGRWGEERIKKACLDIYNRGHDVQLHTHPEWISNDKRINMYEYTEQEQDEIIKYGIKMLKSWTGEMPIAHRAGGYSIDENTIKALKRNNLKFDYSMFYTHENSKVNWSRNNIISKDGTIEIPVTICKRGKQISKVDIDWLEFYDIKKSIILAKNMNIKCLVLFMHSYSYFKFDENYNNIEADYKDLDKFVRILDFIKSDDEIKVVTAKEFAKIYENNNEEFIYKDVILDITNFRINEEKDYEKFYKCNIEKAYFYKEIYQYFKEIDLKRKNKLDKLFKNSFKKDIGIYGTGEHTKCLMKNYRRLVGKLDFNVFFFDSNEQKWNTDFLERKVYSPDKINELNLDRLIISSYEFQEEIYKALSNNANINVKIIKIYEKNDNILFVEM